MSRHRILGCVLALLYLASGAAAAQTVTELRPDITPVIRPFGITARPDGNLWFTEHAGDRNARITPPGVVTEFEDGSTASGSAAGSDDNVRLRTWAIIGGGVAAIAAYGMNNWWQDGFTGNFQTGNEGWFGQNTNDGGADKLGHAYATYVGTRLLARSLEWAGNDSHAALNLAAWSTFGVFTAVEVADAFTTKWKFSKEDVIMNGLGVGLAVAMEKYPDLDRLIDFRLLYRPSDEPRGNSFDPFGDYSGQTYLLVVKASGIEGLRHHPLLRYFELAVGYGTRGYGAPPDVPGDPSRNIYAGISINLSEVLGQTVFAGATRRSPAQRAVDGFLEVVQIPGTVALTHRRL